MQFPRRNDANATNQLPPRPLVAKYTGDFDGNDGRWSTFWINVGSDGKSAGQNFKVLISTSSPITLLPKQAEWCDEDCASQRGVDLFKGKQPRGLDMKNNWEPFGAYDIPMPHWYTNNFLGSRNDTPGAAWGVQNVALDRGSSQANVIANRYVAGYTTRDPYMGSLGLAIGEISPGGASRKTFLTGMEEATTPRLIASSSYGYTAGAIYRNNGKGIPGNLVFGGYDKSRLANDGISISMPSNVNTTLVVGINSIIYQTQPGIQDEFATFTVGGFDASIDSTFPYLVLPDDVCDSLAKKFELEYDEDLKLYTVNPTSHDLNKRRNATLTFKVANSAAESVNFTNIVFPYAAFDLEYHDADNSTPVKYFPIKKSENNMYVLGRAFLQEAYIVVDYERTKFTVAPAFFGDLTPPEDLKTILSPNFVPPTAIPEESGEKLPTGAVAGIVVGIVVAFIIAGLAFFCFWKKRKSAKQNVEERGETSEIDTALADSEIRRRRVSELTGSETIVSPKSPHQDYWSVDHKSIPPISEMSPDSPPAELYSPPVESASDRESRDYFTAGQARRYNSGRNTPGTPAIAELSGDEGVFHTPRSELEAIGSIQGSPKGQGGLSDASLTTNIDERLAELRKSTDERTSADDAQGSAPAGDAQPDPASTERRPSHTRGLSDTTVNSDTTVISQPTPEEEERWAREPRRPLSE